MALSNDLVSQFAKIINNDKKEKTETTVYGTIVEHENSKYVKLDGSDLLTPVSSTTTAKNSERVTVMIKNHSAVVTGNLSSPSARSGDIDDLSEKVTELNTDYSNFVTIDKLDVEKARIDELDADNVTIKETLTTNKDDISKLKADNVTITGSLNAHEVSIESLSTNKLNVTDADSKYATIENLNATNENVRKLNEDYTNFKETSKDWVKHILDVYPVGSIYISYSHTSPATLFGGTWERISNRFLWGCDSTGTIGATGGESTVTLTIDQIPSHNHDQQVLAANSSGSTTGNCDYDSNSVGNAVEQGITTGASGGGGAHNNMPPYIQVSIWRRTA